MQKIGTKDYRSPKEGALRMQGGAENVLAGGE